MFFIWISPNVPAALRDIQIVVLILCDIVSYRQEKVLLMICLWVVQLLKIKKTTKQKGEQ